MAVIFNVFQEVAFNGEIFKVGDEVRTVWGEVGTIRQFDMLGNFDEQRAIICAVVQDREDEMLVYANFTDSAAQRQRVTKV
jgi:hypothetical protein